MKQEATINRDSIVLDFSTKFCNSHEALLESDGFRRILSAYLTKLETRDTPVYEYLWKAVGSKEEIPDRITKRSEEHTSELQSRQYLVCRLLLEKKKNPQ